MSITGVTNASETGNADLLDRHRSDLEHLFNCEMDVSADLWHSIQETARLAANTRTIDGYENACECLLLLRQAAQLTCESRRFNAVLANFRQQNQTKSMLIAMVRRRIYPLSV